MRPPLSNLWGRSTPWGSDGPASETIRSDPRNFYTFLYIIHLQQVIRKQPVYLQSVTTSRFIHKTSLIVTTTVLGKVPVKFHSRFMSVSSGVLCRVHYFPAIRLIAWRDYAPLNLGYKLEIYISYVCLRNLNKYLWNSHQLLATLTGRQPSISLTVDASSNDTY